VTSPKKAGFHILRLEPASFDRRRLVSLLGLSGAVLLEGWSDAGAWSVALPWPEEVVTLPWSAAGEWASLVREIEATRGESGGVGFHGSPEPLAGAPFLGGWVGFVCYDAGALTEGSSGRTEYSDEPAAWFARHESGIVVDPGGMPWLFGPRAASGPGDLGTWGPRDLRISGRVWHGAGGIDDSMGFGGYSEGVERIRGLIRDGEVYQVNLTRRLAVRGSFEAKDLYLGLTDPAPPRCAAFINGGDWAIASASPEVLLEYDRWSGVAESRPIKGTVRRSGNDVEEIARLVASEKDASEHLMIVDLVRNDLGKVAPPGRVTVPAYRTIRTLPYVHHLESSVRAEGIDGCSTADVLAALFPGGSITGAPKRAAVTTIRELEPCARGVYTGAIGYLDDRGRSSFSVAIRTAVVTPGGARYHAGGGIVWDSDPDEEDQEAMTKAEPFLRVVREGWK